MTKTSLLLAILSACGASAEPDATELYAYRISEGTSNEILLREVERGDDTSVVEVFVHRFGGALGGSMFQAACLADIAKRRGKSHFVKLSSEMTRRGTQADPGNDSREVIGFCDGDTPADLAAFAEYADSRDATVFEAERSLAMWSTLTKSSIEEHRVAASGATSDR